MTRAYPLHWGASPGVVFRGSGGGYYCRRRSVVPRLYLYLPLFPSVARGAMPPTVRYCGGMHSWRRIRYMYRGTRGSPGRYEARRRGTLRDHPSRGWTRARTKLLSDPVERGAGHRQSERQRQGSVPGDAVAQLGATRTRVPGLFNSSRGAAHISIPLASPPGQVHASTVVPRFAQTLAHLL